VVGRDYHGLHCLERRFFLQFVRNREDTVLAGLFERTNSPGVVENTVGRAFSLTGALQVQRRDVSAAARGLGQIIAVVPKVEPDPQVDDCAQRAIRHAGRDITRE
jgi:hypothetical protein